MLDLLKQVRAKAVIGFVGGSDLPKITEQLAIHGQDSTSPILLSFHTEIHLDTFTSHGRLRLLLRRERPHRHQARKAPWLRVLYWLHRRGQVQEASDLHPSLHRRPRHPCQEVRSGGLARAALEGADHFFFG